MMTRQRLAICRRPRWWWRQGPAITWWLAIMVMWMRGRPWRPDICRPRRDTARPRTTRWISLPPVAGPTRWHGPGPLPTLSKVHCRVKKNDGTSESPGVCRSRAIVDFASARWFSPELARPPATNPCRPHRASLQCTKWGPRLDDTADSGSGCHCVYDSACSPGTWVATRWKKTDHVTWVPPSCQQRHSWIRRRNKGEFLTKSDFNKRPHLRATDERYSSHKLSSFRCSNLPGKATGIVRVQTDIRTRARRKSKWTTGGYSALRRCGCARSRKGTQFHCLKFRLGSAGEPTACSHCYDVFNDS